MRLKTIWAAVKRFAKAHKAISIVIAVVIIGAGYIGYNHLKSGTVETRYVLATVTKGTLITNVTGSGQVIASNQVDVKPQVSGTVTWVGVKQGDQVAAGQALATLDSTDAEQALANAKAQYAADQLQYQKDSTQAPINYQSDQQALATAQENLTTDYNSAYNDITNTYLDSSSVISGAQDAIYGYEFDARRLQQNLNVLINQFTTQDTTNIQGFATAAKNDYTTARSTYDTAVALYQKTPRTATTTALDSLLSQTITMTTGLAQVLQSELNFFGSVSDLAQTYNIHLPSQFSTVQSNTRNYLSTANSHLSTLLADQKTLSNDKQAITNAQNTLTLDNVGNPSGSNPISLQLEKNNLEKEQQTIADDETNLSYYTIRSPFAGTVGTVDVKAGDSVSTGTAVATVVTHEKLAQLSLNEIDAAKVKVGQLATLTFDAVDGLSIAGTVSEVDTVGTVSQGVVTYNVQIAFDTQDSRVKTGMSVNASIITEAKQDALMVPTSAVTTSGGTSYVQVFPTQMSTSAQGVTSPTPPTRKEVTTGISNDTDIEIVSGLSEGDQVVTRTINGTTASAASSATPSLLGGGGGGFRAVRIGG